ncbi:hypothetical protein TWF106_002779 [Orbilia oligospora]|uniref:Thioredoxin-like fold domain-containing protein n=1 Tax=Orbilia oligospora TaxID=2813651 RepID=A0A7C8Q858_ORBOL|nr:hypothetical protein TWF106_002779 [Orbilia oligospora]
MPSALQDALRAPAFIRRLFSQFPLVTHPVDPPPMCIEDFQPSATRQHSINHTLYSFTDSTDSSIASFNPTCLKWQTYLKIRNIPFKTQPSNNHASPSGSLPFLTISSQSDRISQTIPSPKLAKWIEEHAVGSVNTVDTDGGDYRAFSSLVEGAVRDAWLYALYIDPENLSSFTIPKYTAQISLWPIPQILGSQMRQAAIDAIRKSSTSTSHTATDIYERAIEAFRALSILLSGDTWFFGAPEAGMFDAEVFAYTHLLLNLEIGGSGREVVEGLGGFGNLVEHEERIRRRWF